MSREQNLSCADQRRSSHSPLCVVSLLVSADASAEHGDASLNIVAVVEVQNIQELLRRYHDPNIDLKPYRKLKEMFQTGGK
ncbi:MAG: hypothetical protein HOH04_10465 [Rhodospirillaceae bacterium]|jgi:hypothetical protein|nr:hypothetical protein [Rhodospirillaceae bacterium]